MRKLLLIRHAKSSWKELDLDDHERPLNARGDRDRVAMARHLTDIDEALDVIYSSTAVRALDLAQTISDFTGVSLVPDLSFYTFEPDELLEIVRHLPNEASRVAVVGHNPAVTQAVNQLTGAELANVPTSGVVAIDCNAENWQEISSANCELNYFVAPKLLNH